MKYFVYNLNHDKGAKCVKTGAMTKEIATSNIMLFEGCPKCAIEIHEVPLLMWSMKADTLLRLCREVAKNDLKKLSINH